MSQLAEEMAANALEAQRFSRKHLVLELDFSPHSVEELEGQVDAVEYAIQGGLSDENVEMLVRIWGGYLGESLRKQNGGEWIRESDGGAALRTSKQTLYPLEQVRQRLADGAGKSIWAYFQQAQEQENV